MIAAANAFDTEHTPADPNKAIRHPDDFCTWAWSVGVGRVPETFFNVDADDIKLETHRTGLIDKQSALLPMMQQPESETSQFLLNKESYMPMSSSS